MARMEVSGGLLGSPGHAETIRAFTIFAVLLAILLWAAHSTAYQDVSEIGRMSAIAKARDEAMDMARDVALLGRGPTGIDFFRLRQQRSDFERFIGAWISDRPDLQFVDIIDRFGTRVASVPHDIDYAAAAGTSARVGVVVGGVPLGEVRVGVSPDAIDRNIETLRRGLRIKVMLAAALGVSLLSVGLFYSLHLIQKNRELDQRRQSSERAEYRVNLGSGLAHEIRNPLNSMNMNLQMLEEELQGVPELEGGEHIEMLRSMQAEIKRIANLIDAFLQYSRPTAPQFAIRDLNEALAATARFLQADFRQSGVELDLDLEPLLPSVEIDEAQLRQALLNILGNARQVTPSGGRVRVSSRAGVGGEVVIDVADTGPGIPPEILEKIFDPFFSKRAGGTGLGLAIARQMVENHKGRINVESTVGRGTVFSIRLPRRQERTGETATRGASPR